MANDLLVSVAIGGVVAASFNAVFGRAKKTVKSLGDGIDQVTSRHQRLGSVIDRGVGRSHKQLGKLVRDYRKMGKAIDAAKRSQLSLATSIDRQHAAKEHRRVLRGNIVESGAHTVAIGGVVAKSLQIFSRQEDAATDLKLTMMKADGSVGEFNNVLKQTKRLGKFLPGTTEDFIRLGQALKSQGMSDEMLLSGGLENAAKLSVVMNMGQAEGGEFFMKMAESYGLSDKEFGKAADITQRGHTAFGLKKDDMFETMKYSAPTVNALGLTGADNYEKLMAVQGMGAQKGLEGSSFGTNFSQMLLRFAKGPKQMAEAKRGMKAEAQEILESVGVAFEFFDKKGSFKGIEGMMGELEKLQLVREKSGEEAALIVADAMFGAEAARPALILAEKGRQGLKENLQLMRKQADLQQKIAAKTSTFSAAMEQLGGVLELTAGTFGSAFAPEIKSFANAAQSFIETTLQPWIENNKELIKWTVGAAFGLMGFKSATFMLSYAASALISPFRSIIIAGKKMLSVYRLFKLLKFSGLSKGASIMRMFVTSTKSATAIAGRLSTVFGRLRGAVKIAGRAVIWLGRALLTNPIGLAITAIAGAAFLIYRNWDKLKPYFSALWNGVKSIFTNALNAVKSAWSGVSGWFSGKWQSIQSSASSVWNGTKNLASQAWSGVQSVWSGVGTWFGGKWQAIKTSASNLWTGVKASWTGTKQWFANFGTNLMQGVTNGVTNGVAAVRNKIVGVGTSIKTWFKGVLGINSPSRVFAEFGTHLMQGLINGLGAMLGKVKAKIMNIGSSVASWFKDKLGIKSPSRVFMGFGGFISEGLGIGIDKQAKSPIKATQNLANAVMKAPMNLPSLSRPAVNLPPSAMGIVQQHSGAKTHPAGGGISVQFAPTIHVDGNDAGGIKQSVEQALQLSAAEFERMFNDMIDQRQRRAY